MKPNLSLAARKPEPDPLTLALETIRALPFGVVLAALFGPPAAPVDELIAVEILAPTVGYKRTTLAARCRAGLIEGAERRGSKWYCARSAVVAYEARRTDQRRAKRHTRRAEAPVAAAANDSTLDPRDAAALARLTVRR